MNIFSHNYAPEMVLDERLAIFHSNGAESDCFAVPFCHQQYYLPGNPDKELVAMYELTRKNESVQVAVAVTSQPLTVVNSLAGMGALAAITAELATPLLYLDKPLRLDPVAIVKPWGQEIWYTGIEERGRSNVTDGKFQVPLPWVLALAPRRIAANLEHHINLLKILDPVPQEVYGDLYFELHEKKQEVYVVTHVDKTAWPDGVGAIRFGFGQHKRREIGDDRQFRASYVSAVARYEEVRRQLDSRMDDIRAAEGFALDAAVPASMMQSWQQRLPAELLDQEVELRREMNTYTAMRSLKVGDVVRVPVLTPHALQHGVRTVEFQTPVYERKILSFAQKVLTQNHWDTTEAAEIMTLEAPRQEPLEVVGRGQGYVVEQVARFADFGVRRLVLEPGHRWRLPDTGNYALAMAVNSGLELAGEYLPAEQAYFLPAHRQPLEFVATGDSASIALLAEPSGSLK